jgi:hypothetical protein
MAMKHADLIFGVVILEVLGLALAPTLFAFITAAKENQSASTSALMDIIGIVYVLLLVGLPVGALYAVFKG